MGESKHLPPHGLLNESQDEGYMLSGVCVSAPRGYPSVVHRKEACGFHYTLGLVSSSPRLKLYQHEP
jgi:hypothetical protein